jgi:hypothetical protein
MVPRMPIERGKSRLRVTVIPTRLKTMLKHNLDWRSVDDRAMKDHTAIMIIIIIIKPVLPYFDVSKSLLK